MNKPQWSIALAAVLEIERQADKLRSVALDLRCAVQDSAGVRCTADETPEHEHRYRMEDLPR